LFAEANSDAASCWNASWNVEPLPCSVPDTGAPAVVLAPLPPLVSALAAVVLALPPPAAVVAELLPLSSPHAAANSATATTTVSTPQRRALLFTSGSP